MKPRALSSVLLLIIGLNSCGLGTSSKPLRQTRPPFTSITLQITGGEAGVDEKISVLGDGSYAITGYSTYWSNRSGRMRATDISALRRLATSQASANLKPSYNKYNECCDQFDYSLTIVMGQQSKSTEWTDFDRVPNIIDDIERLLPTPARATEPKK